jgi:pyridoxal phosphate enzyme (YggS family)
MPQPESIQERFAAIQEQIRTHAGGAQNVTVVAVSKYATVERMRDAYQAGLRHFGENKVQDALAKMDAFPKDAYPDLHWHFIGTLQTNKVKKTVGRFDLIHTVDSVRLAEALSEVNLAAGLCQPVLLQINLSADPDRHGFLPEEAAAALEPMQNLAGIRPLGLMTMAPPEISLNENKDALRPLFCRLRELRNDLSALCHAPLPELSMGMSHDFPHALACGATIIRIGNYLFKN